jgi:glutamate--cysteine ligase
MQRQHQSTLVVPYLFLRYVDYAMDVPMYFVYREGKGYINTLGMSWRDFMEGKLPALPGEGGWAG